MTIVFPGAISGLAAQVLAAARARRLRIVTAESCTGGLVSAALTDIAGSSDVFDRGFCTYSNDAKRAELGVSAEVLTRYGAVSAQCAEAMAAGALAATGAGVAVAITGIAGPGGGSPGKPVGLVHLAALRVGGAALPLDMRYGDIGRAVVRSRTTQDALTLLLSAIEAP